MSSATSTSSANLPPPPANVVPITPPRLLAAQALPPPTWEEALDLIEKLVGDGTEDTDFPAVLQGLLDYWGVKTWVDLGVFDCDDFDHAIDTATGIDSLKKPICRKRLCLILDFARSGNHLYAGITIPDIIKILRDSKQHSAPPATAPAPAATSGHSIERKTVPTLDHFSGKNEDYFSWSERSLNKLGTAGLARYLTDPQLGVTNPEVAEAVFYCLKNALHGGHSQHVATAMSDQADLDPCVLWSTLTKYFDTALNRANVVLYEIQRLLGLRLDADILPSKFISDFNDSILRLSKNHAALAADNDTLRALLLVAIQDDAFDPVREIIIKSPASSIQQLLNEIRDRESSLEMKDGPRGLTGDGVISSRRAQVKGTTAKKVRFQPGIKDGKWFIPRFPSSWKDALGSGIFQTLLQWRGAAIGGKPQAQLDVDFKMDVEEYTPGKPGHGKRQARRGKSETDPGPKDATPAADSDTATRSKKRIRLAKSRRVVAERS